ncbi:triose-phosphate transporter family-domain-containing protein, partial [Protomyces lactucae-debilis]
RFVCLCILWYSSSALTNTSSKTFLNALDAPVTLTLVQFFFVAAWTALLAQLGFIFRLGFLGTSPIRRIDMHVWRATAPMSLFVLGGHLFSSFATSKIPVSTVHTIKALSPMFTVLAYCLVFRVSYSIGTYISLVPLTIGVMLACSSSFSTNGNLMGLVCALGSTLIFVSQNIFSKHVLFHEKNDEPPSKRLDKLNLLFYSSFMAFVMMIPIWLLQEYSMVHAASIPWEIYSQLVFNGASHAAQNVLAFTLLSMVSPVTYSIASLIKRIFVIVVAILWFGQPTNRTQAFGITLTALGLFLYDRAKGDVARGERRVEKIEAGAALPLSVS